MATIGATSTKVETAGGVFQVREDEPEPRVEAGAAQDTVRAGSA
jgi:hypothetical protein